MKKSLRLCILPLILAAALAGGSCSASNNGGEGASIPSPATPFTPPAAASASTEDPIDITIKELVLQRIGVDRQLRVRDKHYYTDPANTNWIGFGVEIIYDGGYDLPIGVVKRVPGGDWELVSLGTGPASRSVPDDVKKGLGIP